MSVSGLGPQDRGTVQEEPEGDSPCRFPRPVAEFSRPVLALRRPKLVGRRKINNDWTHWLQGAMLAVRVRAGSSTEVAAIPGV